MRPRCLVSFLGICLVISLGMRCDARAVSKCIYDPIKIQVQSANGVLVKGA